MTQEVSKMFEAVSKVVLSAPKALQKTGLDLVNFGPFYGLETPLTSKLPSSHLIKHRHRQARHLKFELELKILSFFRLEHSISEVSAP
jgi:hypothetical protein